MPAETTPALLVVVTVSEVWTAVELQVIVLVAGLPATVPGEYVQPVVGLMAPKVAEAMSDSGSVPLAVRVRLRVPVVGLTT